MTMFAELRAATRTLLEALDDVIQAGILAYKPDENGGCIIAGLGKDFPINAIVTEEPIKVVSSRDDDG